MSKASDAVGGDMSRGIDSGGTEANCGLRSRSKSILRSPSKRKRKRNSKYAVSDEEGGADARLVPSKTKIT